MRRQDSLEEITTVTIDYVMTPLSAIKRRKKEFSRVFHSSHLHRSLKSLGANISPILSLSATLPSSLFYFDLVAEFIFIIIYLINFGSYQW